MDEDEARIRVEALDRAVRVNLANGGMDSAEETVKRAEKYLTFLKG